MRPCKFFSYNNPLNHTPALVIIKNITDPERLYKNKFLEFMYLAKFEKIKTINTNEK
jgi:hypothetical protein